MIVLKSKAEIGLMKEAGKVLIECFARLEDFIKPGVSTLEIADLVDKTMAEMGAINAEKGYGGFPGSACVSVNEVLVHGIPSSKKVLHDGDIVSVDSRTTSSPPSRSLITTRRKGFSIASTGPSPS